MDMQSIGRVLLLIGVGLAVLGGLILLLGRYINFGSLPGDIRIEGQGFTCIVPIASMILLSVILTIILNVVIKILNRP